MPLCSSGTTQPKSGIPLFFAASTASIGAILYKFGYRYAVPFAAYAAINPFDVASLCSTDPVADPDMQASDWFDLLTILNPPAHQAAVTKFGQLVEHLFWYEVCECAAVTTPSPPSAHDPPPDMPVISSPGTPTTPCATYRATDVLGDPSVVKFIVMTGGITVDTSTGLLTAGQYNPIPPGATSVVITHVSRAIGGVHSIATMSTVWLTAVDTPNGLQSSEVASGATIVTTTAVPSTATRWYTAVEPHTAGTTDLYDVTLEWYCGASSTGTTQPCCPPDPILEAELRQIKDMLTLIQRQSVPFGYVYGDNHTALSGHGSFAVSDLLGVSVDITTLPDSYGRAGGSPEELFGLGFVTLGTADGWEKSRRVDHDGSLFLPTGAGAFTAVGYDLSAGVVVSIRELVREP